MSNPAPDFEEMAALHALGLLDETSTRQLLDVAERDPQVLRLLRSYGETAAALATDVPPFAPPAHLHDQIMDALPNHHSNVIPFSKWFPFAIAACLMVVGITEAVQIFRLTDERRALQERLAAVSSDAENLRASNALIHLRLAALEAKDPAYAAAKVLVAWDTVQHQGSLALDGLAAAPVGRDYQLWVLDPEAPQPVSAGVFHSSEAFATGPVSAAHPGFAISLEPTGGSRAPTGPILFAVSPSP